MKSKYIAIIDEIPANESNLQFISFFIKPLSSIRFFKLRALFGPVVNVCPYASCYVQVN